MLNPPMPEIRVLRTVVESRPRARPRGFDLVTTPVVEALGPFRGPWRTSADDELICCLAGGLDVETLHGRRLVGPGCGILIPGRTLRRIVLREGSSLRSVLLAPRAERASSVLPLADLLLRLIDFLHLTPMHPACRREAHAAALELLAPRAPAPRGQGAAGDLRELLGAPDDPAVERWVRTAGPRGLMAGAEADTLEWEYWIGLGEAVRLLEAGARAEEVARLLRRSSISELVRDFRTCLGREPGARWESGVQQPAASSALRG